MLDTLLNRRLSDAECTAFHASYEEFIDLLHSLTAQSCKSPLDLLHELARLQSCLMRLRRALGEFVIEGMKTTIPLHQKLLDQGLVSNAFVLDEERLVRYSTLARQTQREDMLAAVLKGASLEAFALKLTDLPSASDEGAGLAMLSESDEAVPSAPAGATGSGGLIDAMLRMPLETGQD